MEWNRLLKNKIKKVIPTSVSFLFYLFSRFLLGRRLLYLVIYQVGKRAFFQRRGGGGGNLSVSFSVRPCGQERPGHTQAQVGKKEEESGHAQSPAWTTPALACPDTRERQTVGPPSKPPTSSWKGNREKGKKKKPNQTASHTGIK